jgi:hypothetical protein
MKIKTDESTIESCPRSGQCILELDKHERLVIKLGINIVDVLNIGGQWVICHSPNVATKKESVKTHTEP